MADNDPILSYDRTVDIVRSAIPRMSEMKIPITPSNYAVWYEYLNESNQPLRREMDVLLSRPEGITEQQMQDLYERYLTERTEKIQIAKTALSQLVRALMSHIDLADGHYSGFSNELHEIARSLEGDTSTEDLNRLIDRAVCATNAALDHGAELKQKITALADEMQDVRNKLAISQVEARSDALTGLLNRLAFQEKLDGLAASCSESEHAPCLLLIDIDRFKRVNDTYGHLAGDVVLESLAAEIKACLRGRDIVARYGGEEFGVLLLDTPRPGCLAVAENVRTHIDRYLIKLPDDVADGKVLSVSVSVGGAWLRESDTTKAFVDRADRALYQSKDNGRNRVSWENRKDRSCVES